MSHDELKGKKQSVSLKEFWWLKEDACDDGTTKFF